MFEFCSLLEAASWQVDCTVLCPVELEDVKRLGQGGVLSMAACGGEQELCCISLLSWEGPALSTLL